MRLGRPLTRILLWILAAVAIAIAVDNMGRPLANPDEGRYSEISREMAATGDWITPRLNGVKYFEKPPLQYWASAAAFRLLGENEHTARLYTALCGFFTLLVVAFTGSRLWGREVGVAALLVLASSPYFMALGGIVTLDMGLTFWTTLTFCAWLLGEFGGGDARSRRRWMLVAWAAMAGAVLSKGLVGVLFPAAALTLHCLLHRDLSPLGRLQWGTGTLVFLGLAAPWFVAVSLANPEFPRFFFVHEHFERFLTTAHRRTEPAWYFVPILFAGFLPWMLALPAALAHGWRARDAWGRPQGLRVAILWSVFVVAFFSASGSKLPHYILPAFPPLALVLGRYLVDAPPRRLAAWIAPVFLVGVALGVLMWLSPRYAREAWTRDLYTEARLWGVAGAALLAIVALAAPLLLLRGRRWAALVVVALGMTLVVDCFEDGYERFAPRQSGLVVADKMKPFLTPATRLYSVKHYDQTVPFYIGRTLRLVDYVDEFGMGLALEPQLHLERLADFPAEWQRPGEAMAIMQPGTYESLREQGLPMQLLHEDPRRVLVRKP